MREIKLLVYVLTSVITASLGVAAVGFALDIRDCRKVARAGYETRYSRPHNYDEFSYCYVREGDEWIPLPEWKDEH